MSFELKILGACLASRDDWDKAKDHVNLRDFSPEAVTVMDEIADYYKTDPNAKSVDTDILKARIKRKISSAKHEERMTEYLSGVWPEQNPNIIKEVLNLKAQNVGLELAHKLIHGQQDDQVLALIDKYKSLSETTGEPNNDEEFVGTNVEGLVHRAFDKSSLIRIAPKSLNDHLDGGARPGHHILIFAPTEMGKSLFAINMVSGFLAQNLKVLYIGNEDPEADIRMRLINRLTGMDKFQVAENPKKAQELCDKKNSNNFILASLAPGTFSRISELVARYKPNVVILDQLRNLDVHSDNRTQALEMAATSARNLAKKNGLLVVSVTQAGDSASGKRKLNRGDVDSSNVGIPGQCDLMIGIGATEDMEERNLRTLSFPKNKISGKHGMIDVTIDPSLSKVIDHA